MKSNCGVMFAAEINYWISVKHHHDTPQLMDVKWVIVQNSLNLSPHTSIRYKSSNMRIYFTKIEV